MRCAWVQVVVGGGGSMQDSEMNDIFILNSFTWNYIVQYTNFLYELVINRLWPCVKKHGKIELAMKVTGIDIHKSVYYVTLEKVIDPFSRTWTSIHPDCLCVWSQNVSPHLFIPPTNKIGMSIRLLMSAHLLHFVRIFVHLLSIFCSKADHDQKMCYDPKQGHLVNFNIIGKDRVFKFCPGHFL